MLETTTDEKKKREELKAKRNLLFDTIFEASDGDSSSSRNQVIDDQIAEQRNEWNARQEAGVSFCPNRL